MEQLAKNELTSEHAMGEYLALPKEIGAASSDRLLKIADGLLLDDRLVASNWLTQPKIIAASALTEAALASSDTESIDDRLHFIDAAEELAKEVSAMELQMLEAGHRHPDDLEGWLRAELQTLFMDSYRDIVCGEVTVDHTKPELIKSLQILRDILNQQRTLRYASNRHKQEAVGLMGEVTVLLDTWQRYSSPEDPIALPSTYRGGNGIHNHRQTHDVIFATQRPDMPITHWDFSYSEVKTGKGYNLRHLGRYAHSILRVTGDKIKEVA